MIGVLIICLCCCFCCCHKCRHCIFWLWDLWTPRKCWKGTTDRLCVNIFNSTVNTSSKERSVKYVKRSSDGKSIQPLSSHTSLPLLDDETELQEELSSLRPGVRT